MIAVKRDAAGRGGSISMADDVAEGDRIDVSEPRNEFGLSERARSFVFVAGGIGITPVLSMMRHLKGTAGRVSSSITYRAVPKQPRLSTSCRATNGSRMS